MSPPCQVSVVSFNIRGIMDRWPERRPLLAACLKTLDADVVAFQEVLTGEFAQDQLLLGGDFQVFECRAAMSHLREQGGVMGAYARMLELMLGFGPTRSLMVALPEMVEGVRERFTLSAPWARVLRDVSIAPFFGNSIASRLPLMPGSRPETLLLGDFRAAQRVCLVLRDCGACESSSSSPGSPGSAGEQASGGEQAGGSSGSAVRVWLVNTHLDHAEPRIRRRQAQAICDWMQAVVSPPAAAAAASAGRGAGDAAAVVSGLGDGAAVRAPALAGVVITGDLNAPPHEDAHAAFEAAGYRSACKAANGCEPKATWPSGLIAPLMDKGEPHCADYVYVWEAPGYSLHVAAAAVSGDTPAATDPTLFPSDHLALHVTLRVGARRQM